MEPFDGVLMTWAIRGMQSEINGLRAELEATRSASSDKTEPVEVKGKLLYPVDKRRKPAAKKAPAPSGGKRKLSAKGRKAIADAQKKRWAEKRKAEKRAVKQMPNSVESTSPIAVTGS